MIRKMIRIAMQFLRVFRIIAAILALVVLAYWSEQLLALVMSNYHTYSQNVVKTSDEIYNHADIGTDHHTGAQDEKNVDSQEGSEAGNQAVTQKPLTPWETGHFLQKKPSELDSAIAKIKDTWKQPRCERRNINHIAFLNVHRAGSTTMEYIFHRYSIRNNLTFFLPKIEVIKSNGNEADGMFPEEQGVQYDILAYHSIYNRKNFTRHVPEDSLKIAIVRDPLERMISAAYYYRDVMKVPYLLEVPKENFIENLIRNNHIYEKSKLSRTRNSMAKDFGFPEEYTNDNEFISNYIDKLTTDFNIVLILEKFEESLVLMKRYLNWELFDILFFPAHGYGNTSVSVSNSDKEKFRSDSNLDYAIYEEFSILLERKIKLEEKYQFADEVRHLKTVLGWINDFCNRKNESDFLHVLRSRWTCGFVLTPLDCQFLKEDPHVIFKPDLIKEHEELHRYT